MSSIKNNYYHWLALSLSLGLFPISASAISLTLSPAATAVNVAASTTENWTASASVVSCSTTPSYSIKKAPTHGTTTPAADFASSGRFSYTNDGTLGAVREKLTIEATCDREKTSITLKLSDAAFTCTNAISGRVIFDNTATAHLASIKSNLKFYTGCDKGVTTISTGKGGNAINIEDFHVLTRNVDTNPDKLMLSVGAEELEVNDQLVNTTDKMDFFADGKHLFELNRLRSTADWLSGSTNGSANISPDVGVGAGAYGTMTLKEFVTHIKDGHTLYGVVRIKVGLQKGQRSECSDSTLNANCTKNALGLTVASKNDLYGFCDGTATTGLCSATACAPSKASDPSRFFNEIEPGVEVCGIALTSAAKIKVKGSLLFDFVDHITGNAIPLAELPYAPKELYFKISTPIMVNWANDNDADGAMDSMTAIKDVSVNSATGGELTPTIAWSDIPLESKQAYQYQVGSALDSTKFGNLSSPDKYHLLMPSGYANGWSEAFNKLNITTALWADLPPSSCVNSLNSACAKFGVPADASTTMVANDVRSNHFEDIPTYLYSGGLIDMHHHVNISGLVYVPQAMELEAKSSTTRQYISGSIVIRDGFYIEADTSTITVISADPQSYSSAKRHVASTTPPVFNAEPGGPGSDPDSETPGGGGDNNDATSPCIGCASGGGGGSAPPGKRLWMEVRP